MRRCYSKINFRNADKLTIIEQANTLIEDYRSQGYVLTLRQLYYQFVAKDLFPESWIDPSTGSKNSQKNYKRLGDIIADGRMAGLIDWTAIEDRTRALASVSHWDSPSDILGAVASQFAVDKWDNQPARIEIWVEKDALEGIATQAAHSMDVAAFSCRGYGSLSSLWEASQRLKKYVKAGQRPVILHLGDHDPSGIDMTRDIDDRLNEFLTTDWLYEVMKVKTATMKEIWDSIERRCGARNIEVRRIALTREQVDEYQPPPNPAKQTDSRYVKYAAEHGDESWELDALEPSVLDTLITETIKEYRDYSLFKSREAEEQQHQADLKVVADNWGEELLIAARNIEDNE